MDSLDLHDAAVAEEHIQSVYGMSANGLTLMKMVGIATNKETWLIYCESEDVSMKYGPAKRLRMALMSLAASKVAHNDNKGKRKAMLNRQRDRLAKDVKSTIGSFTKVSGSASPFSKR